MNTTSPASQATDWSPSELHSRRFFGGRVLLETHKNCQCSYCGRPSSPSLRRMRYGLNVPPAWRKWNSWWVIKFAPGRYLRWGMPKWFFPVQMAARRT